MSDFQIECYLAGMDGMDWAEWRTSRVNGLKAIDHLRLFYYRRYIMLDRTKLAEDINYLLAEYGIHDERFEDKIYILISTEAVK